MSPVDTKCLHGSHAGGLMEDLLRSWPLPALAESLVWYLTSSERLAPKGG